MGPLLARSYATETPRRQGHGARARPCGRAFLIGAAPCYKRRRSARMLPSSSGQDAALSRLKPGFDSPWERQVKFLIRWQSMHPIIGAGLVSFTAALGRREPVYRL